MRLRKRVALSLLLTQLIAAPLALAQVSVTPIPSGALVKFVILSRHGVRSPIPSQSELDTWTTRELLPKWPTWHCPPDGPVCDQGQLTEQGSFLAGQMGTYYKMRLSTLLPVDDCPAAEKVFFWADLDERTQDTARALLGGFRSKPCDVTKYFHTAAAKPDKVFHPVTSDGPCTLNVREAREAIRIQAKGSLENYILALKPQMNLAQKPLQCCTPDLCVGNKCIPVSNGCTLPTLPNCLVDDGGSGKKATEMELGGGLRIASTFAELLLLEYANGFDDVGWGQINPNDMAQTFKLHTAAFELEQRTPYIARLQGSRLLRNILYALQDGTGGGAGTAPPNAKFVAYVGHDTNIANVAGMLGLHWEQSGYQQDQTPPAGALTFELLQRSDKTRWVYVYYIAQSLGDMRNRKGGSPKRTPVRVPGCGNGGFSCRLSDFATLVGKALDKNKSCWR
jgi:4-phytase / acid phosphatase